MEELENINNVSNNTDKYFDNGNNNIEESKGTNLSAQGSSQIDINDHNLFSTDGTPDIQYTAEMVSKMNLHEILDGTYSNGESKTYASFVSGEIDIKTNDIYIVDERGLPLVITEHIRTGSFVQLNLQFRRDAPQDLRYTYESISRFAQKMQKLNDEKEKIPFITFNIIPQELGAQIAFTFSAPVFFSLSADNVRNRPNTISMLFEAKNVAIEETELSKQEIIRMNNEILNQLETERRRQEEREKAYEEAIDEEN